MKSNSLSIPIIINCEGKKTVKTLALIGSGAGGKFIDQNYAKKSGFILETLEEPLLAQNVEGTENKHKRITKYVNLNATIHGRTRNVKLLVTGLGKQRIILGFPWLNDENPDINRKTGEFKWWPRPFKLKRINGIGPMYLVKPSTQQAMTTVIEEKDEQGQLNKTQNPLPETDLAVLIAIITDDPEDYLWINAKSTNATIIQAEINSKQPTVPLKDQIPKEFHEILNVFSEKSAAWFPEPRPWDHKIELKDTFIPNSFKTYNLTPAEQIELDNFLKGNLDKGYIWPSQSPMASPFFFVNKKDGKLRLCQDYQYLNEHTVKNAYPLPLISELLDKLKGARHFTKLDVRWGYNNIRIRNGDQWKAAFKTNKGLFKPTVMFFGMCNSLATFQSMMDAIFSDMIDKATLTENTKRVLVQLQENNLFLKPEKCEFNKPKVKYLGMIIEERQISMNPGKLSGIRDWPAPTTVKQVQGFLGFGNLYQQFIWNFSELAKPLNEFLKKEWKFKWTDKYQQAFDTMKWKFTEEPVLGMLDHNKPF